MNMKYMIFDLNYQLVIFRGFMVDIDMEMIIKRSIRNMTCEIRLRVYTVLA